MGVGAVELTFFIFFFSQGDLVIEFCLDTLKSTAYGATPSKILTPREKKDIYLGKGADGIGRRGVVERVSVSLRRSSIPQPHDSWELSIFVPEGLSSKDLTKWSDLETKLKSGSHWTKLAIRDPRRLVLEIVRNQLSWKDLSMELRKEVSLTVRLGNYTSHSFVFQSLFADSSTTSAITFWRTDP